ncbi:hypothetical protein GTO89_04185 [Heliobacterium gestii]|uniref:HPt domain-containing protein n=1 Tax=Heliomicrobium gestii TaxID=2699 RepID=A0A845L7M7_HELGE|nr:Hpt domain-containing protein [Heliomicrobium gestii]MBM7866809.1 HPt (histidine-containing phosphotransfer) domain-containing protein [Heliomicrobium gestii]MZP42238.1 hypothetical protein [Heliomicrobium gestii]
MRFVLEEAAASLLLSPEEFREVLEIFFEEAEKSLAGIDAALPKGDEKALKALFHDLKGSAFNFRIDEVGERAKTLEACAATGDWDRIHREFPLLRDELVQIKRMVQPR